MTAQCPERLIYRGEAMGMYTEPLCDYLDENATEVCFQMNVSSLLRGYIGVWEIVDGYLYLIELSGILKDGSQASLSTVFPSASDRVLAHWYSGSLRIPRGKPLKENYFSYEPICEYNLFFEVLQGQVVGTQLCFNEVTALDDDDDDFPF